MNGNDDMESRLRAGLHAHALRAPAGEHVAEQIIAQTDRPTPIGSRRRQWRTWTLPLASAAAVAAVAATIVGISQANHVADRPNPVPPAVSGTTPTSTPPTVTPTTPPVTTTPTAANTVGLVNFRVIDMTFVSANEGWALGTADCLIGGGTCTAMAHTTDGATWRSLPNPPVNVPGVGACAQACVTHIRFADDATGYAYGPSAFFMTVDGGKSWQPQAGGADALETLSGNVIRVRPAITGCSLGCTYSVETAAIGSTAWQEHDRITAYQLALVRGEHDAYVLTFPHTSGNASSLLYRSSDDGQNWTDAGEPCPSHGSIVTSSIAAGVGGRVSVICTDRGSGRTYVAVSIDHGAHFAAQLGTIPAGLGDLLTGDPQTVLIAGAGPAGGSGVYRSTDGGASWQPVVAIDVEVGFAGFESSTVGRVVSADGRTVWTTHDAGLTWTPYTFG